MNKLFAAGLIVAMGIGCRVSIRAAEPDEGELHAPWKYAPDRHELDPRDPYGFRRKSSLLSQASHKEVTKTDEELRQKKLALYGQTPEGGETVDPREVTPRVPVRSAAAETQQARSILAWIILGSAVLMLGAAGTVIVLLKRQPPNEKKDDKTVARSAMRKIPAAMKKKLEEEKARKKGGLRGKNDPPNRRSA